MRPSLACGLIGIRNGLKPEAPVGTTVNEDEIDLPRGLLEAVDIFENDEALTEMLGASFVSTYAGDQEGGVRDLHGGDQSWEREFLLLNV